MMKVGITATVIGWEEKALISSLRDCGYDAVFMDDSKLAFSIFNATLSIDCVIIRSQNYVRGLCLSKYFSELGVKTVNNYNQVRICSNKFTTTLKLKCCGLPVLPTILAFTKEAALEACSELGYPVVIKPPYGGHGNLVALAETKASASGILESRDILGHNFHKAYCIQNYIELERDLRVLVIGGDALCAISRTGCDDWRHNTSRGATSMALEVTQDISLLIRRITDVIGEGIFGVDLFETPNGYVINEINHVCQFRNPTKLNNINIAGEIIEYITRSCR